MARSDPWAEFQDAAPAAPIAAPASGGPRPVFTVPDPGGDAKERRDDAGAYRDQTKTDIAVRGEDRDIDKLAFDKASKLRDDYDTNNEVRAYQASVPMFVTALKTAPDLAGDQLLITSFAKLTDPTTGVLGGEREGVAAGSQSWVENKTQELTKLLSSEGGTFTEATRRRLRGELTKLMAGRGSAYMAQRNRFKADAEAYGVDPDRVIGPNVSDAERAFVREFWEREEAKAGGQGGAQAPSPEDQTPVPGMFAEDGRPLTQADLKGPGGMAYGSDGQPLGLYGVARDETADEAAQGRLEAGGYDPRSMDAIGAKLAQGATLGFSDELSGIGAGLAALVNDQPVVSAYQTARDDERLKLDQAADQQPIASGIAELGGGLLTGGVGAVGAGLRGAMSAGAKAGALTGYGYGEGAAGSAGSAVLGAGVGAAAGRLFHGLASRAGRARPPQPPTPGGQVIQAADRLNARTGSNIRPIPADVAGPLVRRATGAAAQLPLSASPIVNAGKAVTAGAKVARDAIAKIAGTPAEIEAAGEAALNGANKWIASSRTKVNALYARARKLGGDITTPLTKAQQALARNIAELEKVPGGAKGLEELKALREEIAGEWTVEGIKGMRSQLRDKFLDNGLRGSDLERRVGQVIDAAEDDIAAGLTAAGKPEAAKAYTEAAAAYRERVSLIDNVLAPIIGKKSDALKSGEQVLQALNTASKQNNARLAQFLNVLPPDEAQTVRATIISQLGQASKGGQDAEGAVFSLPQFLTHWNAITPGAKRTLFGGELRAALDDLAKVAEGTKEAGRFANFSNTGSVLGFGATAGGAGYSLASHPIMTIAGLAGQYGLGRLLASPKFARALAKVPANSPTALHRFAAILPKVAAADTVIASNVIDLQQAILSRVSEMPGRLAAEPTSGQTPRSNPTTAGAGR